MRFATTVALLSVLGAASIARADDSDDKVQYGIDVRLREVFLPQSLMNLFVEKAAGGAQSFGYGVDLVRRRGNLELQLGAELEHIALAEGVYINKGDNVAAGDTADYILSPEHAGST